MRRYAFVVTILGIFVLLFFLNKEPAQINSIEELDSLETNQRVFVAGKIAEQKFQYESRIFILENGIEVICDCANLRAQDSISVVGFVERYNDKTQVRALKISGY